MDANFCFGNTTYPIGSDFVEINNNRVIYQPRCHGLAQPGQGTTLSSVSQNQVDGYAENYVSGGNIPDLPYIEQNGLDQPTVGLVMRELVLIRRRISDLEAENARLKMLTTRIPARQAPTNADGSVTRV